MSYTIPGYVDTNAQAILAIASAVKGEAVNATDGTVHGALDALADALAGHDIDVPQTSNGAILALAQYVSGGGGGGTVDVTIALCDFDEGGNVIQPTSSIDEVEYYDATSTLVPVETTATTFEYEGVEIPAVTAALPDGVTAEVKLTTGYTAELDEAGTSSGVTKIAKGGFNRLYVPSSIYGTMWAAFVETPAE